ncbi:MAG TPA: hypothetical protein VG603_16165 [Chitinophagales bacterium]|nr:hypothetical protein [Chitinophagales bacterium]
MEQNMDVFDFLLMPIYLSAFYLIGHQIVAFNRKNPLYKTYYIRGLTYKLLGSLGFAFIYLFYYKGGDSISFFYTVHPLFGLFFTDPGIYFKFVFSIKTLYPIEAVSYVAQHGVFYLLRGTPTLTTIRIASILDLFCMNSYLSLCLMFAFISFQFQWRVFKLITSAYPMLHKQLFTAFMIIPSVIFWGSGLSKDSIMLGSIMLFFYCYYNVVILRRGIVKYIVVLFITGFLMALIRGFILFVLVPCLMLMTVTYYRNFISSSLMRFLFGPLMIAGAIGGSVLFLRGVGSEVQSYKLESLQQKAEGFKSWHEYLGETQGGSAYSLGGDVVYTPSGIMRQAPLALIITLFGPFVWQIRSPVMLLSGVESLVFLYVTVRMLANKRIYSLGGILIRNHLIVFCVPFVIILGVAIGLTSFNYGALVRYKIPILPFFATALIIINYHLNKPKAEIT